MGLHAKLANLHKRIYFPNLRITLIRAVEIPDSVVEFKMRSLAAIADAGEDVGMEFVLAHAYYTPLS